MPRGLIPEAFVQQSELVVWSEEVASRYKHDACAICHESFNPNADICRVLDCAHVFHAKCVDLWFIKATFCPMCKSDLKLTFRTHSSSQRSLGQHSQSSSHRSLGSRSQSSSLRSGQILVGHSNSDPALLRSLLLDHHWSGLLHRGSATPTAPLGGQPVGGQAIGASVPPTLPTHSHSQSQPHSLGGSANSLLNATSPSYGLVLAPSASASAGSMGSASRGVGGGGGAGGDFHPISHHMIPNYFRTGMLLPSAGSQVDEHSILTMDSGGQRQTSATSLAVSLSDRSLPASRSDRSLGLLSSSSTGALPALHEVAEEPRTESQLSLLGSQSSSPLSSPLDLTGPSSVLEGASEHQRDASWMVRENEEEAGVESELTAPLSAASSDLPSLTSSSAVPSASGRGGGSGGYCCAAGTTSSNGSGNVANLPSTPTSTPPTALRASEAQTDCGEDHLPQQQRHPDGGGNLISQHEQQHEEKAEDEEGRAQNPGENRRERPEGQTIVKDQDEEEDEEDSSLQEEKEGSTSSSSEFRPPHTSYNNNNNNNKTHYDDVHHAPLQREAVEEAALGREEVFFRAQPQTEDKRRTRPLSPQLGWRNVLDASAIAVPSRVPVTSSSPLREVLPQRENQQQQQSTSGIQQQVALRTSQVRLRDDPDDFQQSLPTATRQIAMARGQHGAALRWAGSSCSTSSSSPAPATTTTTVTVAAGTSTATATSATTSATAPSTTSAPAPVGIGTATVTATSSTATVTATVSAQRSLPQQQQHQQLPPAHLPHQPFVKREHVPQHPPGQTTCTYVPQQRRVTVYNPTDAGHAGEGMSLPVRRAYIAPSSASSTPFGTAGYQANRPQVLPTMTPHHSHSAAASSSPSSVTTAPAAAATVSVSRGVPATVSLPVSAGMLPLGSTGGGPVVGISISGSWRQGPQCAPADASASAAPAICPNSSSLSHTPAAPLLSQSQTSLRG